MLKYLDTYQIGMFGNYLWDNVDDLMNKEFTEDLASYVGQFYYFKVEEFAPEAFHFVLVPEEDLNEETEYYEWYVSENLIEEENFRTSLMLMFAMALLDYL